MISNAGPERHKFHYKGNFPRSKRPCLLRCCEIHIVVNALRAVNVIKAMRALGIAVFLVVVCAGFACSGQQPVHDQDPSDPSKRVPLIPNAVEDRLEERAVQAIDRIHHATSREEIEAGRVTLRKKLSISLGYQHLPWPPKLESTISGTVQYEGFHVDKTVLQSLPNIFVTALLYVPDKLNTTAPAILLVGGHGARNGKANADSQAFAINMVRLGFVVLSTDAIGEGERGGFEEDLQHPEALMVGLSLPGVVFYEVQCELEYLRSLKEVDPNRIGMTGAQGGGFSTWIAMALDDSIAAGVPVDDTVDFRDLIQRMRADDWDQAKDQSQLVPGILRYANIQELIALAAPRPLMIIAKPDTRELVNYGRQVYGSLDHGDALHYFENGTSGYQRSRRQAAYGFFLHALMNRGDGAPIEEPQTQPLPADSSDLRCLPVGAHVAAEPGMVDAIRRLATVAFAEPPSPATDQLGGDPPADGRRALGIGAFAVQRANQVTESGISVPLTILRPGLEHYGGTQRILIAIDDKDKESLAADPILQEAMRRDYLIIEMDTRGLGELALRKPGWVFATSVLLGENFVWTQAWDIRSMLDRFRNFATRTETLAIYARGPTSSLASTYALRLAGVEVEWAAMRGGFTSVRQLINFPASLQPSGDSASISWNYFAFGASRAWDLPQILAASKTKVFIIDPLKISGPDFPRSDHVWLTTTDQFIASEWDKYLR